MLYVFKMVGNYSISLILLLFFMVTGNLAHNYDCDFSDSAMCGYHVVDVSAQEPDFKWQYHEANSNISGLRIYSNTDFLEGSFLYISPKSGEIGKSSTDITAKIESKYASILPDEYCLQFKYRMFGPHVGRLRIGWQEENKHTDWLFSKSHNQGDAWKLGEVWVAEPDPGAKLNLVLEATRGFNVHGEIAVDDIRFKQGGCSDTYESISCTFATWQCGWTNFEEVKDDQPWDIIDGLDDSVLSPGVDYSTGTRFGNFMNAEVDGNEKSHLLLSSDINSTFIAKGSEMCIRFWYSVDKNADIQGGVYLTESEQFYTSWYNPFIRLYNKWQLGEFTVSGETEDVRIFFEVYNDSPNKTYAALDDILLINGSCPIRGNNFFEHGLDLYTNDESNSEFDWEVFASSYYTDMHINDATLNTKLGHYAIALFDQMEKGDKAVLNSPVLSVADVSCLTFSYLFYDKDEGSLDVYIRSGGELKQVDIPNGFFTKSQTWYTITVKVDPKEDDFEIVFEATVGDDDYAYIAIDDIIVTDKSCVVGDDFADWTEHVQLIPSASQIECDFEGPSICNWRNVANMDFLLQPSVVSLSGLGPSTDYNNETTGVILGTPNFMKHGSGAVISPALSGQSGGHCLTFYYWVRGTSASLQVLTSDAAAKDGDLGELYWKREGDQGARWHWARIVLQESNDFKITFKATQDNSKSSSFVAIDNIKYSPSVCPTTNLTDFDTCDFETGICGLTKETSKTWSMFTGKVLPKSGQPDQDFTYKTEKGHYLLFKQDDTSEGDTAVMTLKNPSFNDNKDNALCLQFHYFLSGSNVGRLEVFVGKGYGRSKKEHLWKDAGDHGPKWLIAQFQFDIFMAKVHTIELRAIAGKGTDGAFGLDDFTIRPGICQATVSKATCGFDNFDLCSWEIVDYDFRTSAWRKGSVGHDRYLGFEVRANTNREGKIISEEFDGNQAQCFHFIYTYVPYEDAVLAVSLIPVDTPDDEKLVWKLDIVDDDSFVRGLPHTPQWNAARMTINLAVKYKIQIYAKTSAGYFDIGIDSTLVTNGPCSVEPPEAVEYDCDFSHDFCFWSQDLLDDVDYKRVETHQDQVNSYFVHMEPKSKYVSETSARLISPAIRPGERCLTFSTFLLGADAEHLKILMKPTNSDSFTLTAKQGGSLAVQQWQTFSIDLISEDTYELIFESMCHRGSSCNIGFTNITVSPFPCPDDPWKIDSPHPHCTFESQFCSWETKGTTNVPTYNWQLHDNHLTMNAANGAPKTDFTYQSDIAGHYAFVPPPPPFRGSLYSPKTQLISPQFINYNSGASCMSFAYFMSGSESGILNVYQVQPLDKADKPVWSVSSSDSEWKKAYVVLKNMKSFQIIIEAAANGYTENTLAIDEILITKGTCPMSTGLCDFNDGLCHWSNVVDGTDDFDWLLEKASSNPKINDHISKEGSYLIGDGSFGGKGDKARLISQLFTPENAADDVCVMFYYQKFGAILNVNLLSGYSSHEVPSRLNIWKMYQDGPDNLWLQATIGLNKRYTGKPFKIEFEVSLDKDGGMALDDIFIQMKKCDTQPVESVPEVFLLYDASCTFDDANLCSWHNEDNSDVDTPQWRLQKYVKQYISSGWFDFGLRGFEGREEDQNKDGLYLYSSTNNTVDKSATTAVLISHILPATEGVDCLSFWYYIDADVSKDLQVSLVRDSNHTVMWNPEGEFTKFWRIASINIHSDKPFQIRFESIAPLQPSKHVIEDIQLTKGVCTQDHSSLLYSCRYGSLSCGYVQDDTDDYDWIGPKFTSIGFMEPDPKNHTIGEKSRIISELYSGGGSECLQFDYSKVTPYSGRIIVYAQSFKDGDLFNMWEMPAFKHFDPSMTFKAQISTYITVPFRVVFEHEVTVNFAKSPRLSHIQVLPHACQHLGSCDFEDDDLCAYERSSWKWQVISNAGAESWGGYRNIKQQPAADTTLRSAFGKYLEAFIGTSPLKEKLTLRSAVLQKTSASCLQFSSALSGSASLDVILYHDNGAKSMLYKRSKEPESDKPATWDNVEADIVSSDFPYYLSFEVSKDNNVNSTYPAVYLDDIKILEGSCADQTSLEPTEAPQPALITVMSCDFEQSSELCDYADGKQTNAVWSKYQGYWYSGGLSFDHTLGDEKGHYAVMFSTSRRSNALASLDVLTPLKQPTVPQCVSFWYHMTGDPSNTLTLRADNDVLLWRTSGEYDLAWQHASVILDHQNTTADSAGVVYYYLRFEGVMVSFDGHIALDDIQVYNGTCPPLKSDTHKCNFESEDNCGFISTSNSNSPTWQRVQASLDNTNFYSINDHTYGTALGHFMYCDDSGSKLDRNALISPVYKYNPNGQCLTFWYKLFGAIDLFIMNRRGTRKKLFTLQDTTNDWEILRLNIRSKADFQIVFKDAFSGLNHNLYGFNAYTMLDDFEVTEGVCHEIYNCGFEEDLCAYTVSADVDASWVISSGSPPPGQPLRGPTEDHTSLSAAGQYLVMKPDPSIQDTQMARLTSQIVYTAQGQKAICFMFWRNIKTKTNETYVQINLKNNGDITTTRGPFSNEHEGWVQERVNFPIWSMYGSPRLQIEVVGTVEADPENYIAIDDIEVTDRECEPILEAKFQCKDAKNTKVQFNKMCDFVSDCPDGSDEHECGSCSFETSWCKFSDESDNDQGWVKKKQNWSAKDGPAADADGKFLEVAGYSTGTLVTNNDFNISSSSCVVSFSLFLPSDSSFTVSIRSEIEDFPIYTTDTKTNGWEMKQAHIGNMNVPFKFVMKATSQSPETIGLDKISLSGCGFPAPSDKCSADEFQCNNKACIPYSKVCDFTNDCRDRSDERSCSRSIRYSFEYGFGNWVSYFTQSTKWGLLRASSTKLFRQDHTPGHKTGKFLYPSGNADGKPAYLLSPVLKATGDSTDDLTKKPCELRFFYSTTSKSMFDITVYTKAASSGVLKKVFHKEKKEGLWYWVTAVVSENVDFQVVIESSNTEKEAENTRFVLDDVSLYECKLNRHPTVVHGIKADTSWVDSDHATVPTLPTTKQTDLVSTTVTTEANTEISTPKHEDKPTGQSGWKPKKPNPKSEGGKGEGTSASSSKVKSANKSSGAGWKLPVGLTLGFIALALLVVGVFVFLRKTNRLSGLPLPGFLRRFDSNAQVAYSNDLYDNPASSLSVENPTYEGDITISTA